MVTGADLATSVILLRGGKKKIRCRARDDDRPLRATSPGAIAPASEGPEGHSRPCGYDLTSPRTGAEIAPMVVDGSG